MKRIISAAVIIVMLTAMLGGCAKKNENPESSETTANNQQTEAEKTGNNGDTDKQQDSKKPDQPEKKPSDNKNTSENNNQTQKPADNASDNPTTAPKPSESEYQSPSVSTGNNNDLDPEEIEVEHFDSDGKVDTRFEGKEDELPYVDQASTTVSDFTVTADNYNEEQLSLPIIKINTSDGKDITSKTEYVSSTVSITNTVKNHTLTNAAADVRGRGNSTWQYFDKKAYKLKFTVKTDLFGMGAAKKWVLLANALDESMMRNYIAFSLGKMLGLEYTSDFMFVNVFLNNEYKGVYLLCEQVQEGKTRVNINSSKNGDVDTGYLLEGINNSTPVDYKTFTLGSVNGKQLGDEGRFTFIIKSPELAQCTDEQRSFIKDYVKNTNEAIFKKDWDKIQQYIDVDSFVNMFLLDEIMLNQDMGYSFYMYKKQGGKLYMGPMWDFDQACGSSSHGGSGYKGWYAGSELEWFTSLIEIPQFRELVAKRYAEKKSQIHSLLNTIDSTVNKYSYDFAMSNYVYNTFGKRDRWRTMSEIAALKTYKEHIIYLKTWLTNRFIWMENQLGI